ALVTRWITQVEQGQLRCSVITEYIGVGRTHHYRTEPYVHIANDPFLSRKIHSEGELTHSIRRIGAFGFVIEHHIHPDHSHRLHERTAPSSFTIPLELTAPVSGLGSQSDVQVRRYFFGRLPGECRKNMDIGQEIKGLRGLRICRQREEGGGVTVGPGEVLRSIAELEAPVGRAGSTPTCMHCVQAELGYGDIPYTGRIP